MGYDFDFGGMVYRAPAFGPAILVTLRLTGLSCVFGSLLGIPIASLMLLPSPLGPLLSFLVHAVRAVPDLVLFFFYYYFPYQAVFGINPPSPFFCAFLAMATALAAFAGDLFREAIRQAPRNQLLGLRALGFTERQLAWHVIFPAVVRHTLPALAAFWIGVLKMSSLASVLGVADVVYVAKVGMAQSYRSIEAWIAVAIIYMALVTPLVYALKLLQRCPWLRRQ